MVLKITHKMNFCGHTHVLKKLVCGSLLPKNGCVVFSLYSLPKLGGAVIDVNIDVCVDVALTLFEISTSNERAI